MSQITVPSAMSAGLWVKRILRHWPGTTVVVRPSKDGNYEVSLYDESGARVEDEGRNTELEEMYLAYGDNV